jgi:hypothetical protein
MSAIPYIFWTTFQLKILILLLLLKEDQTKHLAISKIQHGYYFVLCFVTWRLHHCRWVSWGFYVVHNGDKVVAYNPQQLRCILCHPRHAKANLANEIRNSKGFLQVIKTTIQLHWINMCNVIMLMNITSGYYTWSNKNKVLKLLKTNNMKRKVAPPSQITSFF